MPDKIFFLCEQKAGNAQRLLRMSYLARSASRSERKIGFILPAREISQTISNALGSCRSPFNDSGLAVCRLFDSQC